MTMRHRSRAIMLMTMLFMMSIGCAGGLVGSKEEKLAYFDSLEKDTLARLIKEQPGTEQELARSVGFAVIEKKVVKVPIVGAGGGAGVVVDKASGKKSYLRVPELQFGWGWGGRAEKVILIFRDAEMLRDLAAGTWNAGSEAELAAKAGDIGAAGAIGAAESEAMADLMRRRVRTYVLTDAGLSATVTIGVLRAQPYSID